MILKCQFCEFQREAKYDLSKMERLSEPDLPFEDYMLILHQMLEQKGYEAWNGVKIHMGKMHKSKTYKYIAPDLIMDNKETELFNRLNYEP